ncbi:MAG TPA: hypothetical protein VK723_05395 [Thermoplasmata archaeon]|nr:hypothetical protein [Thermoplasmata archaeon]
MLDPFVATVWYVVSGGAALVLVALLLANHVFELDLAARTRRLIDLSALVPSVLFVAYILGRPFA